ncbi:MAG: hypothetical protein WKG01_04310 [Kofleriaceae bacterium]
MRGSLCAAIAAIAIGLPAIAAAEDVVRPLMDPDRAVQCARDQEGKLWRLQCDHLKKVCLYAPNDELDSTGTRAKPLERARACPAFDQPFDRAKLEAEGYTMLAGRPDAPYGWTRDERGRVFQINFDLHRRFYLGAAYTPQKILENPLQSTRTSVDFGLLIFDHLVDGETPTRHRFRLFEGEVHLEPFSAEMVVAHYDVSRRFLDPLLRLTTFVGRPQRHDLRLNLGLWTEAGGLEVHRTDLGHSQLWKHANAQVTIDLWQSRNLDSFARVRSGLALEGQHADALGYRSALVPGSAFELDTVLDDEGFHNLRLEIIHELPRYFIPLGQTGKLAQRLKARIQYEAIVLAINDQPLTLKLAAGGEKRDDIPGMPHQWAFVMDAGLRFSLWAPPRARL